MHNYIYYAYSRARSTKTRIETSMQEPRLSSKKIREQDPLKQGLKQPPVFLQEPLSRPIREQDPLKQGLKHETFSLNSFSRVDSRARSTKTRIET